MLPLTGIRVFELKGSLASSLAAQLLAEQGADVVCTGTESQGDADEYLNRGKGDLGEIEDPAAEDLARRADIVIEQFRSYEERAKIDWTAVRAANPALVHITIPSFASDDADNRRIFGTDGVVGAASGLYTDLHIVKSIFEPDPVYTALPLPSVYAAVHAATAAVASLFAREKSGGKSVEVSLMGSAMSAMGSILFQVENQPPRYDIPPLPRWFVRFLLGPMSAILRRMPASIQRRAQQWMGRLLPPFMDTFECKDGRLLYVFAMDHRRMPETLLRELGILDDLERSGTLVREDPYRTRSKGNNLWEVSLLSRSWKKKIRERITSALKTRPAAEWEKVLNDKGIPCAVQRSTAEWLAEKDAETAGMTIRLDTSRGSTRQSGPAVWLNASDFRFSPKRAESLASLQSRWTLRTQAPARQSNDLPLQGIRVLDLSSVVAAPMGARTLGEYGAEVIKVQAPDPYFGPRMTCWFGVEVNQGKSSVLLDLKKEEARKAFARLARTADIVVHNYRKGIPARLGAALEDLARANPKIIAASVRGFQGPNAGPRDRYPGYDPVVQAATGIMTRYGSPEQPELHALASCVDCITGYLSAFSVMLALFRKKNDQGPQRACTSLVQGSALMQCLFYHDFPGKIRNEPSGQDCRGESAWRGLYRAKDGWIFLDVPESERGVFAAARSADTPSELEKEIRTRTSAAWTNQFRGTRIGCHTVDSLRTIHRRALAADGADPASIRFSAAMLRRVGPGIGAVRNLAPWYARINGAYLPAGFVAHKPGEDGAAILKSAGLSDEEIRRLYESGGAARELAEDYLPE